MSAFEMDALDRKALNSFPGLAVRKDLTRKIKNEVNIPTYVLEYMLGLYCATDDEEAIQTGLKMIKDILVMIAVLKCVLIV